MRKLILDKIKKEIENGDDEIVEDFGDFGDFGDFVKISQMSDENLLNVYDFIVGFRG